MSRALRNAASLAAIPTLVVAPVLLLAPGWREAVLQVYVPVLGAAALAALVMEVSRRDDDPPVSPLDRPPDRTADESEPLPELARLERTLELATGNAFDVHYRLRPVLREIAGELLAARQGVELDRDRSAARELLGERTWELVRPDRERPHDDHAPGLPLADLRDVVASLERIA